MKDMQSLAHAQSLLLQKKTISTIVNSNGALKKKRVYWIPKFEDTQKKNYNKYREQSFINVLQFIYENI